MQKTGVLPDKVTMVSVISACAMSGALDLGRWVHTYIDKRSIENDLELSTALVNMYAKCGYFEKAIEVFEAMPVKDAKAWSSMIVGLAVNGLAEYALVTFSRMNKAEVEPNHVTLVGVLMACAHSGLVSEGKREKVVSLIFRKAHLEVIEVGKQDSVSPGNEKNVGLGSSQI
ncbi:hypothetical protein K7X08_007508 [Anisodus acutangulus]|uniref:Pentatricopeptide repeat-containing protein n=1 Tax=Anisodus acutangulus TaxID=402998 RepID=A0A9Q1R1N2_9SOLA|nr:hypothetical protein K7X08_007508 [Anisodus acutangulus]